MNRELIQIAAADNESYLDSVLAWGLDVIRFVQEAGNPAVTAFMAFISNFVLVFAVPVVLFFFWCINEKKGFRLGLLVIVSFWVNSFIKTSVKEPRPFSFDPSVGLAFESSFSFPSGHSQTALTLILPLAYWAAAFYKKNGGKKAGARLIWTAAALFILLVGLSRIYLGVHFPTDVAGGWITGGIVTALFFLVSSRVLPFVSDRIARIIPEEMSLPQGEKRGRLIAAAAAALFMKALFPEDASMPAILLGFSGGYGLMLSSSPFAAKLPAGSKIPGPFIMILRFFTGGAGAALVYYGLRLLLPGESSIFAEWSLWGPSSPFLELGRFIRYALLGFWVSAGAPRVFGNLGLTEINGKEREGEKG